MFSTIFSLANLLVEMERIRILPFLIVLLSLILLCGCLPEANKKEIAPEEIKVSASTLSPTYVFESKAMSKGDSLFWAYQMDQAKVVFEGIDSLQLSATENAVRQQRLGWFAAQDKKLSIAKSHLQASKNSSTLGDKNQWNIILGQLVLESKIHDSDRKNELAVDGYLDFLRESTYQKSIHSFWNGIVNNRLGVIYFWRNNNPYNALEHFKLALSIFQEDTAEQFNLLKLNNNLTSCERELGNYEGALSYAYLTLKELEKNDFEDTEATAILYSEFAGLYFSLNDVERSSMYYDKAIEVILSDPELDKFKFIMHDNYGRSSLVLGDIEKAKKVHRSIIKYCGKRDTFQLLRKLEFEARLYEKENKKDKAIATQNAAIDLYSKYTGKRNNRMSMLYANQGSIYETFGEHRPAISSFKKSLELELKKEVDLIKLAEEAEGYSYLLTGFGYELGPIARNLQLLKQPFHDQISNVELSQKLYDALLKVFDKISKQRNEGMVLRDLNEFNSIFGEAINCTYAQIENEKTEQKILLSKAFNFCENGKAVLLNEGLYSRSLANQLGVPKELYKELQEIGKKELDIEQDLIKNIGSGYAQINDSLADLKAEKLRLIAKIKKQSPQFFEKLESSPVADLASLESWAKTNDQTVLQFHWSDAGLFVFGIGSEGVTFKKINETEKIKENLRSLISILSNAPKQDALNFEEFKANSIALSALLFDEVIDLSKVDNLVVIPDGLLSRLPFEILTTQRSLDQDGSYFNYKYLIREFPISYAYSATTLLHSEKTPLRGAGESIGLFAFTEEKNINFYKESKYPELTGASLEVNRLGELFKEEAEIWKGLQNSKAVFMKEAPAKDIIYLGTHAETNSENLFDNKIIFKSDNPAEVEELYAYELYGLNFNTDLIVLSSCQTGSGIIKKGEGVYSMARGFLSAGVPSVVMSLWNIDDVGAKDLVPDFFTGLKDGKSVDESMRLAKISILDNSDEIFCHPYYWAPLVCLGRNASPFKQRSWF